MDYIFFQNYWWFLISLLAGILVFLLFVQGGQSLLFSLGKATDDRKMLVNSTGRKWEFTFTTLVTFGGAFFASFPLFYSTSFGGAYWLWMIILFCFILQAVSYEFQSKKGNFLGKKTYQIFLLINGFGAPLFIGVAVGTMFHGANFMVDKSQLTEISMPVISSWSSSWHGLEALANIWNLCLGLALFFLSRVTAILYFINNIADDKLVVATRKRLLPNAGAFLLFFLTFLVHLFVTQGYRYSVEDGVVTAVDYLYFLNMIEMPYVLVPFLVGVVCVLWSIGKTFFSSSYKKGIWFCGVGTILTVTSLLLALGWNQTAYYPSLIDMQSSLTIRNSSSSLITLQLMSVVSLLIPFVFAYIFYTWRTLDFHKISSEDLKKDHHSY